MFQLAFVVGIITIIFKVFNEKKRKAERLERQKLLDQQQHFFNMITAMQNGVNPHSIPMPTMANPQAETTPTEKKFSIGWIVFFVLVAVFLALLLRPYLMGLSVLGWDDFWRAMSL